MPAIPVLRRLRQEALRFQASLYYRGKSYLNEQQSVDDDTATTTNNIRQAKTAFEKNKANKKATATEY